MSRSAKKLGKSASKIFQMIKQVARLVHTNYSQTVNKVEAAAGISYSSCHKNLMT
jgi:hypothetical protein